MEHIVNEHVKIICDIKPGDELELVSDYTERNGHSAKGTKFTAIEVLDRIVSDGGGIRSNCESGFLVRVEGLGFMDVAWFKKSVTKTA